MQILRETNLEALKKAKKIGKDKVISIIEKKNLVGRGGASFPVAKKWKLALKTKSNERYLICNADEGEPGTFKDKFIIKNNPKTMIEGMLISCFVLDVREAFIYLRKEYDYLRRSLEKSIKEVLTNSKSNVKITIVRGAGSYVCGEETAIIQSIMGNRGTPIYKPPYPIVRGLWEKPTVINNVETFTCIPQALLYDDWNPRIRLFSISGDVLHPGVYEWELGVKVSTILDTVKPKENIKAVSLGCFGGIMPLNENSIINEETICRENCQHGAFTLIFIGESNEILDINISIAKFYTYESCGKCTPCREGTIRLLNLLKRIRDGEGKREHLIMLEEFANHIQETSLCGLGQSCGNHILTSLKHFRKEFENKIK
ncbi:MAG: NADH-ubiquinone oxidoreductase-F iron-sulfur binding region domain-containing protein [Candidatus Pacearchaeota archaeon]